MELVDGVAKAIKRFMNDRAARMAAEKEEAEAAAMAEADAAAVAQAKELEGGDAPQGSVAEGGSPGATS